MRSLLIPRYIASAPNCTCLGSIVPKINYICSLRQQKNILYQAKHSFHLTTRFAPKNIILLPTSSYCKPQNVGQFSTTSILCKSKDRGKEKKKGQQSGHVDLRELGEIIDTEQLLSQYENSLTNLKDQFTKHLSVRTALGSIEEIPVNFEGTEYKLQELVQISRKPNMIVLNVSAFPQTIPNILSSISKNQMNLNPQQDGTTLYVPIPKVTKEHRENLSKSAKAYFIKCRDNIKDIRTKYIKILKKDTGLSIDVVSRAEGYIDILCHQYIAKAQDILEIKQKELLGYS